MSRDPFEDEIRVKQRPTFLTVLCILTFIGSGLGLVNSIFSYFRADAISKMINQEKAEINKDLNEAKSRDDNATVFFEMMGNMAEISSPEIIRKGAIANFIPSLLCLVGAILMWKLRKSGFYIYTLGTILGVILILYILPDNFITRAQAGVPAFVGLLFVIFYAMNLKSMNGYAERAEL